MTSALTLDGRVALITGASRGIGAAMARTFAQHGARLVLTAREGAKLDALAKTLEAEFGTECLALPAEATDAAATAALYKTLHARFGRLDILAANAGLLKDGLLGMVKPEDLREILAVNVEGAFAHVQAAARLMRRNKPAPGGSIILTSSIIGRVGNAGQAAYAASKAALLGLMRSAAKELGPDGIRVNALAPGFIETDMTAHLSPSVRAARKESIALRRFGSAAEVADAALFLSSDLSRYVSGQTLGVDGGMVI